MIDCTSVGGGGGGALLFKSSDLGGSAGQGFPTARLTIPGTVCTFPTFAQPSLRSQCGINNTSSFSSD